MKNYNGYGGWIIIVDLHVCGWKVDRVRNMVGEKYKWWKSTVGEQFMD